MMHRNCDRESEPSELMAKVMRKQSPWLSKSVRWERVQVVWWGLGGTESDREQ